MKFQQFFLFLMQPISLMGLFILFIYFFHFYLLSENYNESYAITYLTYGLTTVYIIQEILKSKGPIQSKDLA